MKLWIVVIASALSCLRISGQSMKSIKDGNSLQQACAATEDKDVTLVKAFNAGQCYGFIHSIVETEYLIPIGSEIPAIDQKRLPAFCMQQGVTVGQETQIVSKYLSDHPESLHKSAALLIRQAFSIAFPC